MRRAHAECTQFLDDGHRQLPIVDFLIQNPAHDDRQRQRFALQQFTQLTRVIERHAVMGAEQQCIGVAARQRRHQVRRALLSPEVFDRGAGFAEQLRHAKERHLDDRETGKPTAD